MPEAVATRGASRCARCATEIAVTLLSCPSCGQLVHATRLGELAKLAGAAESVGDRRGALGHWRDALDLLPPAAPQTPVIAERVAALSAELDREPPGVPKLPPQLLRGGAIAAGVALFLWKFKVVIPFLLTKGKLLIGGLTKVPTLSTMLLSLGVYWAAWGWKFAAGLVISIYIHEMGHIAALRHYGVKSTVPMFIPGLGAMIRARRYPNDARENARIGLAGPLWGLGAAVAAYVIYLATGWLSFAAIAGFGAWINLFNLLPIWQLDGGHAFGALTRRQRWAAFALIVAAWALTREGLLILLAAGAAWQAWQARPGGDAPAGDRETLWLYGALVGALTALTLVRPSL